MTYAFALDLIDDPALIAEYEQHHTAVWPEIEASIREAGITSMLIYRVANRLFMLVETDASFTFERKAEIDRSNPVVQRWEALMSTYQQAIPGTDPSQKWVLMHCIYDLNS